MSDHIEEIRAALYVEDGSPRPTPAQSRIWWVGQARYLLRLLDALEVRVEAAEAERDALRAALETETAALRLCQEALEVYVAGKNAAVARAEKAEAELAALRARIAAGTHAWRWRDGPMAITRDATEDARSLGLVRHVLILDAEPEPVPCRGAQGLWTVPEDVTARVRVAFAAAMRGGP